MVRKWFLAVCACCVALTMGYTQNRMRMGSEQMEKLIPLLAGKRVALIVNHTSRVGDTHLVDTLLRQEVQISKIMVPEHGFRGTANAGATIRGGRDAQTGLPIVSLYGQNKRPTTEQLKDVDIILFDIQDVGARFYTYISTMHYAMEAAAENHIPMIVCDRPNPKDEVDGPILETDCSSFIGVAPIPLLHGLTVGELAQMINGEKWLRIPKDSCQLTVIPVEGWRHGMPYALPVMPSPNLKSDHAIAWYPSLCLFEATILSVGRGTDYPFEVLGYPHRKFGVFSFKPESRTGATDAKHRGKICYGMDYRKEDAPEGLSLQPLIHFQQIAKQNGIKLIDRMRTFELLAGNKRLAHQIESGMSEKAIRATWQKDLKQYHLMRRKYLLYPESNTSCNTSICLCQGKCKKNVANQRI